MFVSQSGGEEPYVLSSAREALLSGQAGSVQPALKRGLSEMESGGFAWKAPLSAPALCYQNRAAAA